MRRLVELGGAQGLHDATRIHDDDAVAEMPHEVEVVADEDQSEAAAGR